jgi:hypothetical protein
MASILDPLVDRQDGQVKSARWYQNAVRDIGTRTTANKLMSSGKLTATPSQGLLNLFFYDPKYKKTLPYYDTFPLVLPLERIKGGFSGINFHYLPPLARFRLLEKISAFATGKKIDQNMRFDVTYDSVKNISMVKPTIKKYLTTHVRSRFLRIDATEAAIAMYLPVQQFKKKSDSYVYRQARSFI